MYKIKSFLADITQLFRDPILIIILLLPLLLFGLIKALIIFVTPLIIDLFNINMYDYTSYILSLSLILTPGMLGTLMAFFMIDDRDSKIMELLSVTPMGYEGYLFNRMLLPVVFTIIYTIAGYNFLTFHNQGIFIMILLILLLCLESISIGILLFLLAEDKVKGLTYAKALNIIYMTCLSNLLNNPAITFISSLFPFIWIWNIIDNPTFTNIVLGASVHVVWLILSLLLLSKYRKHSSL